MRILFIVPYTPNLIRVRPYNLIKHLAALGHNIVLLTTYADAGEKAQLAELSTICERVEAVRLERWRSLLNCVKVLPTKQPLQSVYCWQPELVSKLETLYSDVTKDDANAFDVVHVEHLRGALYGLHWQKLQQNDTRKIPVVWDSVDCISYLFKQAIENSNDKFGRWATRLDLHRTERFEQSAPMRFTHTTVTSALDKQAFVELADAAKVPRRRTEVSAHNNAPTNATASNISVVHNGVDLIYFQPGQADRQQQTIVVSGKMSYHANVAMVSHLIENIMPLVWQQRPDVRVDVVGRDPTPALRTLGEHPQVNIVGSVPDIRDYLQRATIAVAPVQYGAGIQNKVLEAMACGTATIASPKAVAALDVTSGNQLLVGGDSAEFANHIINLLNDPTERARLERAGRNFVEQNHNWHVIAKQLASIYSSLS